MSRTVAQRLSVIAAGALIALGSTATVASASVAPVPSTTTAAAPGNVLLSIKVRGALAKDIVRLQTPHGRSWLTLATTRLDGHRKATFSVTVPETRKLRFYLDATKKHKSTIVAVDPKRLK